MQQELYQIQYIKTINIINIFTFILNSARVIWYS